MRHSRLLLGLALLALAGSATLAPAEPIAFQIDPSHSQVEFNVRHFFTRVPGRFNDFAGTILFDDKSLPASSVDVTIQTKSIFTNNDRRDTHLRSGDFFLADSFPTIAFKSTKIVPGESGRFKVEGNLTIRGVTRPVVLDAQFLGMGNMGRAGTRAGFDATTTVDRKDYGILWNRTLDQGGTLLGDDVNIHLAVEAMKPVPEEKPDAAPATKTGSR